MGTVARSLCTIERHGLVVAFTAQLRLIAEQGLPEAFWYNIFYEFAEGFFGRES